MINLFIESRYFRTKIAKKDVILCLKRAVSIQHRQKHTILD